MKQSEYDRVCAANHEAGHAVVAWLHDGIDGRARIDESDDSLKKEGTFSFQGKTLSSVARLAGMVATAMHDPVRPFDNAREIVAWWKVTESMFARSENELVVNDALRIRKVVPDDSDEFVGVTAMKPSDSDMVGVSGDWEIRRQDVARALTLIDQNGELFFAYRDALLEHGSVGYGACRHFELGNSIDDYQLWTDSTDDSEETK